jgi:hypothetical protein
MQIFVILHYILHHFCILQNNGWLPGASVGEFRPIGHHSMDKIIDACQAFLFFIFYFVFTQILKQYTYVRNYIT